MGTPTIRIKYLYHSGFLVETDLHLLIFDYYQGAVQQIIKESPKKIVVFCSHSHPDHYNPAILEWQKDRVDIQYVFSRENIISQSAKNINYLSPYEELELGDLRVKAFNSTDIGVSFLVQVDGMRIFHAGDLNWWYWIDTPEEMAKAERDFKAEVQHLKGETIDIAFFPVDPRLEENYGAGGEYFIRELKPKIFIPMHFGDSPEITGKFRKKMQGSPTRIVELTQMGQEFVI
ncbi:MBL fold metallo-hydrolase [Desulfosporosinus sp. PR]|uniref:MBL fold metallo-hydrolase n=1 Tax=Candidatus Desulfosporosinus nitrosoreducens TaxID=3401928 RepID=UPI0027FB31EC|nr:MBL fold metallo-hydrolase [Desulfosporosinus sp. PR]MDQ7092889.1 MBL fold metallo-hydrolase [Desulfosporosinus sp. PR]